jgi:2-phosphosulfolactate phosphatase
MSNGMSGPRSANDDRSVVIDCFPERVPRYRGAYTIVAVDVYRTTTMLLTALALGRRSLPVPTIEDAVELKASFPDALLAGELGGQIPYGFDLDNSPSALVGRSDVDRPMILVSTSGTRLIRGAEPHQVVYAASLRNYRAQVAALLTRHDRVAVIGAGARGEFREEDALCCAWIAQGLVDAGYRTENSDTDAVIDRWRDAPVEEITHGRSPDFLRETGRDADIAFTLEHVDDVDMVARLHDGELMLETAVPSSTPSSTVGRAR